MTRGDKGYKRRYMGNKGKGKSNRVSERIYEEEAAGKIKEGGERMRGNTAREEREKQD